MGNQTMARIGMTGLFGALIALSAEGLNSGAGAGSAAHAASLEDMKNRYVFIPERLDLRDRKKSDREMKIAAAQKPFVAALKNVAASDRSLKVSVGTCTGEVLVVSKGRLPRGVQTAAQTHNYKPGNDIPTSVQQSSWCARHGSLCGLNRQLASSAIPRSRGKAVRVAVLDTGIDGDALSGLIVDNEQRTFITTPDRPVPRDGILDAKPADDNGHGTHMAGIIASMAQGESSLIQLMALKTHDKDGSGTFYDNIQAIDYAARKGARIINASWGNYVVDDGKVVSNGETAEAVQAMRRCLLHHRGVLFVAAAGNYGNDNNTHPFYPASLTLPNVVSVTSATWAYRGRSTDTAAATQCTAWAGTNFGSNKVHVAAPGTLVLSLYPTSLVPSGQCHLSGSSVATAVFTGDAVLRIAGNPGAGNIAAKGAILSDRATVEHRLDDGVGFNAQSRSGGRIRSIGSPASSICVPRDTPQSPAVLGYATETCRALRTQ